MQYYFYKNLVLVFTEIYFNYYAGFSGQIYFAEWLPTLYNSLWTSLTCLFAFSFEDDTYNPSIVYKCTKLFKAGQRKKYFNVFVFWKWIILSGIHGFIIFFTCNLALKGAVDQSGKTVEHWYISSVVFSCIIHLVLLKLVIETITINIIYV